LKKDEELGERKIIETIQSRLKLMPKMPVPFGDDVSACNIGRGSLAVLKTDMLVGKTDIPPGMSLRQAARKAVIMNVSDFAAKGVKPTAMLVSLGLPRNLVRRDIEQIGDGLNEGAREYGAYVIGGDTGESSDLIISISLFGLAKKSALMLRSGARPGDVVAATGSFGRTAAGLRILLHDSKVRANVRSKLVESVLVPKAKLKEGLALSRTRAVTASTDSSDGLAWSLHEIARSSSVGFLIDTVPASRGVIEFAKMNDLDPLELTFYGGEEYELVVTVKPELFEKARKAAEQVGGELLPIGRVTADERVLLRIRGKGKVIEPRGYEHFRSDKV
jgi:thiamine-monophosphate kinase